MVLIELATGCKKDRYEYHWLNSLTLLYWRLHIFVWNIKRFKNVLLEPDTFRAFVATNYMLHW